MPHAVVVEVRASVAASALFESAGVNLRSFIWNVTVSYIQHLSDRTVQTNDLCVCALSHIRSKKFAR